MYDKYLGHQIRNRHNQILEVKRKIIFGTFYENEKEWTIQTVYVVIMNMRILNKYINIFFVNISQS